MECQVVLGSRYLQYEFKTEVLNHLYHHLRQIKKISFYYQKDGDLFSERWVPMNKGDFNPISEIRLNSLSEVYRRCKSATEIFWVQQDLMIPQSHKLKVIEKYKNEFVYIDEMSIDELKDFSKKRKETPAVPTVRTILGCIPKPEPEEKLTSNQIDSLYYSIKKEHDDANFEREELASSINDVKSTNDFVEYVNAKW
jgi:hypothetical protein